MITFIVRIDVVGIALLFFNGDFNVFMLLRRFHITQATEDYQTISDGRSERQTLCNFGAAISITFRYGLIFACFRGFFYMYSLNRSRLFYCLQACLHHVPISDLAAAGGGIAIACFTSDDDRHMEDDRYVYANRDAINRRMAIVYAARGSFAGGINDAAQSRYRGNGNET